MYYFRPVYICTKGWVASLAGQAECETPNWALQESLLLGSRLSSPPAPTD
jgi:hypothetical protein